MGALILGSKGRAVEFLQSRLGVTVDGNFGPATLDALKARQAALSLTVDGVYGPATNKAMTGRTSSAIDQCAGVLGVEPAAFAAVVQVETAGSGFLDDGRPTILLERLYVYRQATPDQRRLLSANVCAPDMGGYLGGALEWSRFEQVAQVMGDDAASQCVSWGLGQIMGAYWQDTGAASVADFRQSMAASEDSQLAHMAHFIANNIGMHQALVDRDWATFARRYNGPANVGAYALKLQNAYTGLPK